MNYLALSSCMVVLALAACAEPIDENAIDDPAISNEAPMAEAPLDVPEELESDGNVPSVAQIQLALAQCEEQRRVLDAQCIAEADGVSFTCRYSLEGDTPETERESVIAARGDGYTLLEVPEACPVE